MAEHLHQSFRPYSNLDDARIHTRSSPASLIGTAELRIELRVQLQQALLWKGHGGHGGTISGTRARHIAIKRHSRGNP